MTKLADIVGRTSYQHVHDARNAIAGGWNSHMAAAVLCFFDESHYSGDHAVARGMKLLITESVQHINAKHLPMCTVDSYVNIVSASNEVDIAAVADKVTSRRYLSFKARNTWAGPDAAGKEAYFAAVWGCSSHLIAHWLYTLDLDGFNPRRMPRTTESLRQKSLAMHPALKWWYGRLCSRQLSDLSVENTELGPPGFEAGVEVLTADDPWGFHPVSMSKQVVFSAFKREASFFESKGVTPSQFWRRLRTVVRLKESRVRSRSSRQRIYCITAPKLPLCRQQWKAGTKITEWSFDQA